MKIILEQNKIINMVLGEQKYIQNAEYRFLKYVITYKYKDVFLLFNTLTREMLALSEDEYLKCMSNYDIFDSLIKKYFLVEKNLNDAQLKNSIEQFLFKLNNSTEITGYTIMPTLECNARCFYCFEHGAQRYPMTDKVANDVSEFIIKKCNRKKVRFTWFGGEPLYNINPINIICSRLNEKKIDYESVMITNGYLFDEDIIKKAKELWNLKRVQITLDGTEDIYNKCKSFIYKNSVSPFVRVIKNIDLLTKSDIKVLIRINFDNYNAYDLHNLVDFISQKFYDRQHLITMYVWLLYDNRGSKKIKKSECENNELTKKLIDLENYIECKGFSTKSIPSSSYKLNSCGADNKSSVVILPNGKLGKCDHYSDEELYGSIYDDNVDYDILQSWLERKDKVELCETCPLLPQCIKLKKCPDASSYNCNEILQSQKLNKVYRQMKNAYDRYLLNRKV